MRLRSFAVLFGVLCGGCQCLTPVEDCDGERCRVPRAPRSTDPVAAYLEDAMRAAVCEAQVACGLASPEVDCDDQMWGVRYSGRPDFAEAIWAGVDAGALRVDLDAGYACLEALRSCDTTCDPFTAAFIGLVSGGDHCAFDTECAGGNVCDGCTCVLPVGDGAEVGQRSHLCGDTDRQVPLVDGGVRCVDPLPLGAGCAALDDEKYRIHRRCAPGLHCYGSPPVCQPPLAEGDQCTPVEYGTAGCPVGLRCRGTPPRCRRIPRLGEACSATDLCQSGLACIDSVCALPRAKAGEPCDLGNVCAPDAFCPVWNWTATSSPPTCVRPAHEGEPCGGWWDCGDWRLVCVEGRCQAPRKRGERCEPGGTCSGSDTCDHRTWTCARRWCARR